MKFLGIKRLAALLAVPLAILNLAAHCTPPSSQVSAAAGNRSDKPRIVILEPRLSPMTTKAGSYGVYMQIVNQGDISDTLVDVKTEAAGVVEIQEAKTEPNQRQIRPVLEVDIPAGAAVTLEPGERYIALTDLKQPLIPGEKILLTLNFKKFGPMTMLAEVRTSDEIGTSFEN